MPRAVPSHGSSEGDGSGPDGGDPHTPAARVDAAVGCVTQSLEELAETGAAEVILVRHARDADPMDFVDALAGRSPPMRS